MAPVYFPFTHVSPSAAALLGACFSRTAVYQPLSETVSENLRAMAETGRFEVRVPVDTEGEKLRKLLAEYQRWAKLHTGGNLKFFKTQGGRVPFFDDVSAHHISTDIRQRAAGTAAAPPENPLFDARVFLAVAQEFDGRQGELQDGLAAYREMEQKFLQDLKGEPEIPDIGLGGGPGLHVEDPGSHMTEKRLEAFARLAREDAADDRVFITTSRAVFDTVLERIDPSEAVLRIERMPFLRNHAAGAFRNELSAHIETLLKEASVQPETALSPGSDEAGGRRLSLVLHRAPLNREAFLAACIGPADAGAPPAAPEGGGILAGLLEEAL
jgi:hypothetical protein